MKLSSKRRGVSRSISSRQRSLLKTLSWRFLASGTTFLITWIVTGDLAAGLAVGGIGAIVKMAIYYVHERAWHRFDEHVEIRD